MLFQGTVLFAGCWGVFFQFDGHGKQGTDSMHVQVCKQEGRRGLEDTTLCIMKMIRCPFKEHVITHKTSKKCTHGTGLDCVQVYLAN